MEVEQDNRVNEMEPIRHVTDIEFVRKSQMGKLSSKFPLDQHTRNMQMMNLNDASALMMN